MKILVTGASGNVGNYVVEELLKMGNNVVAAGTDKNRLIQRFGTKVDVVEFDFTKPTTFENALIEVDCIFLMRPPHLGNPVSIFPFIDYAKGKSIQLISFLSLMGIEKNTIPPHYKIEKYIESSGIPYAHIRPGFFMQNLTGIHAKEIKEQSKIFIPAGKSKTSFIDAADIGLAIATVLSNPGFLKYRNYCIKERNMDKKYVDVTIALYFMTRLGTSKKVTEDFYRLTGNRPRTFREFACAHIIDFYKFE